MFSSELIPDIFDKCHMTDILKWTADEAGHLDVLKAMRGLAVREAFGLQPVMIAVWTCYLACCHDAAISALQQASDQRLLEVLANLRKAGNTAPAPHTVAKALIGRNALKNASE